MHRNLTHFDLDRCIEPRPGIHQGVELAVLVSTAPPVPGLAHGLLRFTKACLPRVSRGLHGGGSSSPALCVYTRAVNRGSAQDYDSAGVYFLGVEDFEWRARAVETRVDAEPPQPMPPRILVDADACPVKDEVYVVATRYDLAVLLVANSAMSVPAGFGAEMVVVDGTPDAADDWIADHVRRGDVVVTGDIPLASRALAGGASVLGNDGRPFDEDSIGGALAMRDLHASLREAGVEASRPRPLSARDRSRFLSALDQVVQRTLRGV